MRTYLSKALTCALSVSISLLAIANDKIDRQVLVQRHNPHITELIPNAPFSVGNGQFTFTADVTGLQSFPDIYFKQGIPLETKARWAWHSRANPEGYTLQNSYQMFDAYGGRYHFPVKMDAPAGQWLRQNPHDLPFARIGLRFKDQHLHSTQLTDISQTLDLWRGVLNSRYKLDGKGVSVDTLSHAQRDMLAVNIESDLLNLGQLSLDFQFPRGYDLTIKNTPDLLWQKDHEHTTKLRYQTSNSASFYRKIDNEEHIVQLTWEGAATLIQSATHHYQLKILGGDSVTKAFALMVEFAPVTIKNSEEEYPPVAFVDALESSVQAWQTYWQSGAAIELIDSNDSRAKELERRIVLSQYLMGVQSRAKIPTQETGLTNSSWYGKHHTEMAWWHSAHWILWGREENAERVLQWYINNLPSAQALARERGLRGARWAKMVGPESRESPGGNPLIIWNQPQVIHLAELLYQSNPQADTLKRYADLVEQTADAMSSMLSWDKKQKRYSLEAPIWIAQEIYDPVLTRNPTFELSYWRYGLETAQAWRKRVGKSESPLWKKQLTQLAALPQKDGKYVAIESIPDTFHNIESRQDHPSFLASWGLLADQRVDKVVMKNTLSAVMTTWDWEEKIWGWDYPMIAMTAARLNEPELAVAVLLKNAPHNHYLINGHCPQAGAELAVYLPANGALLSAVAMLVAGWDDDEKLKSFPGFPNSAQWTIRAEGFKPLL